jgi:hypothetical protein
MKQKQNNQTSNGPVHRIKSGAISVSIWAKEGSNGPFYTANAQRAFKREGSEEWEHTDSFSRDDLPVVAWLMQSAWAWINRKEQEEK